MIAKEEYIMDQRGLRGGVTGFQFDVQKKQMSVTKKPFGAVGS